MAHYCFIAAYAYGMLTEGYHFEPNRNLTVVAKIDGLKVGWALGAMLYEINALPWEYVKTYTWLHALVGSFLINVLLAAGLLFFLVKAHRSAMTAMQLQRTLSSTPKTVPGSSTMPRRRTGSSDPINNSLSEQTRLLEVGGIGRGPGYANGR